MVRFVLATIVYIRNISSVADTILTKLSMLARSSQVQGEVKARLRQGKVKARSRKGQGKVKVR